MTLTATDFIASPVDATTVHEEPLLVDLIILFAVPSVVTTHVPS